MTTALLFPGQGSQYVGMGKSLWEAFPEIRRLFRTATDLLGFDVEQVCFAGPEQRLNTTLYTQPILFVVDVSVFRVFEREVALPVAFVAGHSLGEYAALVAAGSLTFEDGLLLVQKRARFMQEAAPPGAGGMAAIIGLEAEQVASICKEAADGKVLVPANYNAPNQIVISGEKEPLERALVEVKKHRGKSVPLRVSAPFHSPLMAGASKLLDEALQELVFKDPSVLWVSNVTAEPVREARECRPLLARQVTSPVLWEASIRRMIELGVTRFIELGPKNVLKGLSRKIDRTIRCEAAESLDELRALHTAGEATGGP